MHSCGYQLDRPLFCCFATLVVYPSQLSRFPFVVRLSVPAVISLTLTPNWTLRRLFCSRNRTDSIVFVVHTVGHNRLPRGQTNAWPDSSAWRFFQRQIKKRTMHLPLPDKKAGRFPYSRPTPRVNNLHATPLYFHVPGEFAATCPDDHGHERATTPAFQKNTFFWNAVKGWMVRRSEGIEDNAVRLTKMHR